MDYQTLINDRIKNLRRSNNLTQEEFAEKIDISIQGLSNIERNRYQPTAETVDKICKAFKITPIELLSATEGENEDLIKEISILLSECSNSKLKKIYQVIKMLIKL